MTTIDTVNDCSSQPQHQHNTFEDSVNQPRKVSMAPRVSIITPEEEDEIASLKDNCDSLHADNRNKNSRKSILKTSSTKLSSESNTSQQSLSTTTSSTTPSTPNNKSSQEKIQNDLASNSDEQSEATTSTLPSDNENNRKYSFSNKGLSFLTETSNIIRRRTFCLSEPRPRRRRLNQPTYIGEDEDSEDFIISNDLINSGILRSAGNTESSMLPPHRLRRSSWLIPAEHPMKALWDVLTVLLSFANAYYTHISIRDRQFDNSNLFVNFCKIWFICDILLNFITQHKYRGGLLNRYEAVWARYLTTWFVIDALSLFPGETLYIQPIINQQKKQGFFKKSFFRTKAVVNVTRVLRGRHVKLLQAVARGTGVGASRLVRIIIKYLPKYLMFIRNMRALVAVRVLRQVHWIRKAWYNVQWQKWLMQERQHIATCNHKDDDTHSLSEAHVDEDWDDSVTALQHHQQQQQQPWRLYTASAPLIDWNYYQDSIDNDIGPY